MSSTDASVVCDKCGRPARYGIEPQCRACYWPNAMLAPNVQVARSVENALHERFAATSKQASAESWHPLLQTMREVGARSKAVVAVEVNFAFDFFANSRRLYSSYAQQVRAGVRAPASDDDDARRRIVDASIYGAYGEQMNFAALSTDGNGVPSWGPIYLSLAEQAIAYRSTVLEENSFQFVAKRNPDIEAPGGRLDRLKGSLAVWDTRDELVAVKLALERATAATPPNPETALIEPGSGRVDADYLEVHIFGPFNHQAVERVKAVSTALTQPINANLFAAFQAIVSQEMGKPVEAV